MAPLLSCKGERVPHRATGVRSAKPDVTKLVVSHSCPAPRSEQTVRRKPRRRRSNEHSAIEGWARDFNCRLDLALLYEPKADQRASPSSDTGSLPIRLTG